MGDLNRKQKIQNIVNKYNVSYEKAQYIIETNELYLTVDELKLKYDNPDIGKLPDWLSEEVLDSMIWKMLYRYKSTTLNAYKSDDDLYQELQLHIRKKSNKLQNFKYLKAMIGNYLLNEVATSKHDTGIIPLSLNQTVSGSDEEDDYTYLTNSVESAFSFDTKNDDLIDLINGVRNKQVKQFLIAVGYMICRIDELEELFDKYCLSSSDEVRNDLTKLLKIIEANDNLELMKIDGVPTNARRGILNIKMIIKALHLNKYDYGKFDIDTHDVVYENVTENLSVSKILDELKYYITTNGIFDLA